MIDEEIRKADASPTKEYFVNMITRDINLEDCILDLVDNSVDAARKAIGSPAVSLESNSSLSKFFIKINVSGECFSICDNCEGMSRRDAVSHAFNFGRKKTATSQNYGIGVYGIGMKRAVFKLGENIRIKSTFKSDSGEKLAFSVPIDVNDWLNDANSKWDFDIADEEPEEACGVKIVVRKLKNATETSFEDPAFIQNLRRIMTRVYMLYLNLGLHISINELSVTSENIELLKSDEFVPLRYKEIYGHNGSNVLVEIFGGMAAPPPETTDPEEPLAKYNQYGWYVACNGRIVLAADRTSVSGWGTTDWPQWHAQYSGFIGIVLFSASNTTLLPLTTTKHSVDLTSEVYRKAKLKMKDVSKLWIAYTNERKQALEEAKTKESEAKAISLEFIGTSNNIKLPTLTYQKSQNLPKPANVNYSVPVEKMRKLAREFGDINLPYREVGIKSFEYAYTDFVGEE